MQLRLTLTDIELRHVKHKPVDNSDDWLSLLLLLSQHTWHHLLVRVAVVEINWSPLTADDDVDADDTDGRVQCVVVVVLDVVVDVANVPHANEQTKHQGFYFVSQKTKLTLHTFNVHQPILVIFGRDIAEWANVVYTTWENINSIILVFSVMLYSVCFVLLYLSILINQCW